MPKRSATIRRLLLGSAIAIIALLFAFQIVIGSRPNVLADITGAIRPMNVDITRAEYRPSGEGDSVFDFVFRANDQSRVERVERALRQVPGVRKVNVVAEEHALTHAN